VTTRALNEAAVMTTGPPARLLRLTEVSEETGISVPKLRQAIHAGTLDATKGGRGRGGYSTRTYFVTGPDLEAFIARGGDEEVGVTDTGLTLEAVEALARDLMNQHHLEEWTFGFDKAVTRFGCCHWTKKRITLSRALTPMIPADEVRDTILHEIAHALCSRQAHHGAEWKAMAVKVGARPERCHDGPSIELKWVGTCPTCGDEVYRHRRDHRRDSSCGKCSDGYYNEHHRLVWTEKPTTTEPEMVPAPSVVGWSELIRTHLAKTVESIIATGSVLTDCKAALPFGQFKEALEGAGITPRVAQMFMAVATHPVLVNTSIHSQLPPAYNTLYQLSRLKPPELERALEDGTITPKLKVNDALQLATRAKHARERAEGRGPFAPVIVSAAEEFADLLERDAAAANLLDSGEAIPREEAELVHKEVKASTADEAQEAKEWTFADFVEAPFGTVPDRSDLEPREKIREDIFSIVGQLNQVAAGPMDDVWTTRHIDEIAGWERGDMIAAVKTELKLVTKRLDAYFERLDAWRRPGGGS